MLLRTALWALAVTIFPLHATAQEPNQVQSQAERQPADPSPGPQGGLATDQPRMEPLFAVGGFQDSKVINKQGQEIGTVKQLLIDPKEGRIAYVQIAMQGNGGFFSRESEKIISVPWRALTPMQRQDGRLVLAMDETVLPLAQQANPEGR